MPHRQPARPTDRPRQKRVIGNGDDVKAKLFGNALFVDAFQTKATNYGKTSLLYNPLISLVLFLLLNTL